MTPATLRNLLDTVRRTPGVPVIMGPTAAGKSELAFAIARECGVPEYIVEYKLEALAVRNYGIAVAELPAFDKVLSRWN